MTKINLKRTEDGAVLRISGHSGYADAGHDIVCAGISALVNGLLMSVCTDNSVELLVGDAAVTVMFNALCDSTALLLDSYYNALCAVAQQFPENVKIC